jgi:hypothetical protein
MSWQSEISTILRYLINDVDFNNYKYTDSRIETTILVASQLVTFDTSFRNEYSIDIANGALSPDPTESNTRDNAFINLVAFRSACVILGSEVKTEASNSISIKDGPSAIDLRGVSMTLNELYKDFCSKYDDLLRDYKEDERSVAGQAILGPYSPGSEYISRNHSNYDFRNGYFRY